MFERAWGNLGRQFFWHGSDSVDAHHQALAMLYRETQRQAAMRAYMDVFAVLMAGALIAAGLIVFLKEMDLTGGSAH